MCRLRHINNPVLSSLKIEGLRLLFIFKGLPASSGCMEGVKERKSLPLSGIQLDTPVE
jgi:hypothetical protein